MTPLVIAGVLVLVVAASLAAFRAGERRARRRTGALAGAAQQFCLQHCRLPDGRCPLLRSDMRREDCPLWRFIAANLPDDLPVDAGAPLGAGPYRNPPTEVEAVSR